MGLEAPTGGRRWLLATWRKFLVPLGPPLLLLCAAAYLLAPIFADAGALGGWDQNYYHAFDETARRSLLEFGEFPLWNPFHCGGRTLVGHVGNLHLHPLFWLLALPLGTAIAYKLYLLLHILLGMWGMMLYLRDKGALPTGQLLGALTWGACGYFSWHFAGGHVSYYGLTLIPWVLICLDRGRRFPRYGLWAGLLLASSFLLAGAYAFPFLVLLVGVHSVYWAIAERSARPMLTAMLAALTSVGITAIKFLPVLSFTLDHPRPSALLDSVMPNEISTMLLSQSHNHGRWGEHAFTWPEYGAFIGIVAYVLGLVGAFWQGMRHRHELLMLLFFVALVCGNLHPACAYPLLRKLPVYSDLRVPSRYIIFVAFYLCTFAALQWSVLETRLGDWLAARESPRWVLRAPLLLGFGLALFGGYEVASFGRVEFGRTYNVQPVAARQQPYHLEDVPNGPRDAYLGPWHNIGIVNCYEEAANPRSALLRRGKNAAQVLLAAPARGQAARTRWTPNSIRIEVTLERGGPVLINQNYDKHWHASQGEVFDYRGLLALRLPPGRYDVTLRYRPRPWLIGVALSLSSLLALISILVLLVRRSGKGLWWGLFPRRLVEGEERDVDNASDAS